MKWNCSIFFGYSTVSLVLPGIMKIRAYNRGLLTNFMMSWKERNGVRSGTDDAFVRTQEDHQQLSCHWVHFAILKKGQSGYSNGREKTA